MWGDDGLLFAACYCLLSSELLKRRKRPKRCWMRPHLRQRDINNMTRELREENDDLNLEMRNHYDFFGMKSSDFEELLAMIGPTIARKNTNFRMSISPKEQLAITLRFLTTGDSYSSLCRTFKISSQSTSGIVPRVCKALKHSLRNFLKAPSTVEEWLSIAKDFEKKWNFPHCLGAIGGKHIAIRGPQNSGSFQSIVLTAIVDANYNFIYADVGCQGMISEGDVIGNSLNILGFQAFPQDEELPGRSCKTPFVFVCDNSSSLSERLVKPYTQLGQKGSKKRIFNYRLSRARGAVESAFGMLSSVFKSLGQPFHLQLDTVQLMATTMPYLHNYLQRNNQELIQDRTVLFKTNEILKENNLQNLVPIEIHTVSPGELVRDEFTEYFSTPQGQIGYS